MSAAKSRTRSPETIAAASRIAASILASPRLKRFEERWTQALKGDRQALIDVIDDSGIEVLDDEGIKGQIYSLDPWHPAERRVLKQIVQRLGKYLLKVRPRGRPRRTPAETLKLADDAQRAFNASPVRLKKRYNASRVKQLDIRKISEHVARAAPPKWRESMYRGAVAVLNQMPGIGAGFGDEVAAEACSCTSRQIRSMRTRGQARK